MMQVTASYCIPVVVIVAERLLRDWWMTHGLSWLILVCFRNPCGGVCGSVLSSQEETDGRDSVSVQHRVLRQKPLLHRLEKVRHLYCRAIPFTNDSWISSKESEWITLKSHWVLSESTSDSVTMGCLYDNVSLNMDIHKKGLL